MLRKIYKKKYFQQKDLKYNSFLVTLLINKILKNGKKLKAINIVYQAFNYIEQILKINPLIVFKRALKNLNTKFKLLKKSIRGTIFRIPIKSKNYFRINFSLRLLIKGSKERIEKTMFLKLANEIIASSKKIGNSIKKKDEFLKSLQFNKVFS